MLYYRDFAEYTLKASFPLKKADDGISVDPTTPPIGCDRSGPFAERVSWTGCSLMKARYCLRKILRSSCQFSWSILALASLCSAQNEQAKKAPELRNIEDLAVPGTTVQLPPFADSVFGANSEFRRSLLRRDMALRFLGLTNYTQNTLHSPVPEAQQAYVGERPFAREMLDPILTVDLSALRLKRAVLTVSSGFQWASWNTAGPDAIALTSLYLFRAFAADRIEFKAGYLFNNYEYIGLQVGGTLTSGALGVYATLPYEAGMSYFPLATPGLNLKWNGPRNVYAKAGLQRSIDAAGGPATVARNATGLRFAPHGDKLVTIAELGVRERPSNTAKAIWLRGGYILNSTSYPNSARGGTSSGNFCAYVLADKQLVRSSSSRPGAGLYAGASAMTVPPELNTYAQYYEARTYVEGPFRRPFDTMSLIATRTVYSADALRLLAARGKTFWRNSNSLTASYTFRIARGTYLSGGVSFVAGPSVTPRAPNALTAIVQSTHFF